MAAILQPGSNRESEAASVTRNDSLPTEESKWLILWLPYLHGSGGKFQRVKGHFECNDVGNVPDKGAYERHEDEIVHPLAISHLHWSGCLCVRAEFAKLQPHAAHSAFTRSLKHKWTFTQRTMLAAGEFLQPLEDAIREKFLPSMFGPDSNWMEISPQLRDLIALPARLGC